MSQPIQTFITFTNHAALYFSIFVLQAEYPINTILGTINNLYFSFSLLGKYFHLHNELSEEWDPHLKTKFIMFIIPIQWMQFYTVLLYWHNSFIMFLTITKEWGFFLKNNYNLLIVGLKLERKVQRYAERYSHKATWNQCYWRRGTPWQMLGRACPHSTLLWAFYLFSSHSNHSGE